MSVRSGGSVEKNDGIYLNLKFSYFDVACLVDTGANMSVLNHAFLLTLPKECRVIKDTLESEMKLADGKYVPLYGIVALDVEMGRKRLLHEFWVADLDCECILGLDFLGERNCIIDTRQRTVWIAETPNTDTIENGPSKPNDEKRVYRIRSEETVCIPPNSELIIPGVIEDAPKTCLLGVVEQYQRFSEKKGILVARSLSDMSKSRIPVRVANLSVDPVTVYKSTTLATCEDVKVIEHTTEGVEIEGQSIRADHRLPEHVQQTYDDAVSTLNEDQQRHAEEFFQLHSDAFSKGSEDLGRTNVAKHTIDTGSHRPIKQAARRLPMHKQEEAERILTDMISSGVVEPSSGPWSSPIVLVQKKDGSLRFCVDYRKVNTMTEKDSYPLPRINDSLDMLGGATWFSTLDLASGYWQIEVKEEDRPKTAFVTHRGLYQFCVMPFGLCNAPATFERLMERVLGGLRWESCLVYLDDIIVHATTFEEHIQRLHTVVGKLKQAGLKLSAKKCKLFKRRVEFLGHVVTANGVTTDPKKIDAVERWPVPVNKTEVRSFLGLCTYYRRFVKDFASVAKPLHRLTEKGKKYVWDDDCEGAFVTLKKKLTTAPVLAYPSRVGKFILDTDASDFGVGAVLSQEQGGLERVIAYFSRTLSKSERRYCVTRRELLAIILAAKHFHHYLFGTHFLIRTDHGALRWLLNFRNPEGQTARWIETLGTYDYEIQHRPGRVHGNADALSRRPCGSCTRCEREEDRELLNDPDENEIYGCPRNQKTTTITCNTLDVAERNNTVAEETEEVEVLGEMSDDVSPTWPGVWPGDKLREQQQLDDDVRIISDWKCTGQRPPWEEVSGRKGTVQNYWLQWDSLYIEEGVLYRRFESNDGETSTAQLIVPKGMKRLILDLAHSHPVSGHFMIRKTVSRIRQKYYWSGYRKDIERWCKQCDRCQSRKGPKPKRKGKLRKYNTGEPLQRIAIDIMGPLPTTERGNKYIVVIADYFSKWTEAVAIPNQEAITIAKVLVEQWFCRFGIPGEIHSDQGRQFEGSVFQCVCKLMGIQKTRTTPYHPQSDGMVERFNRTLESMLSAVVAPDQRDWDCWLPYMNMAYNSALHETTGFSPAEIMFGRQMRTPLACIWSSPLDGTEGEVQYPEFIERLTEKLSKISDVARKHLHSSSERHKEFADRRASTQTFDQNDLIWVYHPAVGKGRTSKLHRPWKGPFRVVKRINDVLYRVQFGPRQKPKIVHFNRIRKYEGVSQPDRVENDVPISRSSRNKRLDVDQQKVSGQPDIRGNIGLRDETSDDRVPVHCEGGHPNELREEVHDNRRTNGRLGGTGKRRIKPPKRYGFEEE